MNSHSPIISIVTVSYNAISTIESTILSVLNQTYSNIEYLIIDGGSTDGTADVIKKYADKIAYWISEPDNGIYDAMNKGIDVATGDWINFMNAGDLFYNTDTIRQFVDLHSLNSDIVYGDTIIKLSIGQYLERAKKISFLKKGMAFGHQAAFIKTSFHKKNNYDASFHSSGDYNFFFQAYIRNYKFQYIPLIIVVFNGDMGFSKDNYILARKEDAKITGTDKKIIGRMLLFTNVLLYKIKLIIKQALPIKFLCWVRSLNARRRHLKRIMCYLIYI